VSVVLDSMAVFIYFSVHVKYECFVGYLWRRKNEA